MVYTYFVLYSKEMHVLYCIVFIVDLVEVLQCANVSSNRAEGGREHLKKIRIKTSYSKTVSFNFQMHL